MTAVHQLQTDWTSVLDFLSRLVQSFHVGLDAVRFAYVSQDQMVFDLDEFSSSVEITTVITATAYSEPSDTATLKALVEEIIEVSKSFVITLCTHNQTMVTSQYLCIYYN